MEGAERFYIPGVPNEKQQLFFNSRAKYTAYGGARGGGKSWALRRKIVALCLRYPKIRCLIVRRTYPELVSNHVTPFLREYRELFTYSESQKMLSMANGSTVSLGYCANDGDILRYQGQEYDIIAIDEATQLSESQFRAFCACLRGVNDFPRRMYLTCNPGGVGHAWVKRLFVDRIYRDGENSDDYNFIQALVYDNPVLMKASPEYVRQLEALPEKLRLAWLGGRWDVFEGQFFPEFDPYFHIAKQPIIHENLYCFAAFDYGFDMLALLILGVDREGGLYVLDEFCRSGLTLSEAAEKIAYITKNYDINYAVCSPDLWNRRQDSGKSGFEIMSAVMGMPHMIRADNRRVAGWRNLRNILGKREGETIKISAKCTELIRSLPALLCDKSIPDDASGEPHEITHCPEALRYAVMSRLSERNNFSDFSFREKSGEISDFLN